MQKRMKFRQQNNLVNCLCMLFLACFISGIIFYLINKPPETAQATNAQVQAKEVISPMELQQLLNELEPDNPLVVDGKIGKETIKKWERVYCNQCAIKHFYVSD